MVVYNDPGEDIKSFTQRRSGTLKHPSKNIMIVSEHESGTTPHLENDDKLMEALATPYPNDMRKVEDSQVRESIEANPFSIVNIIAHCLDSALVTMGKASTHLDHYCASLQSDSNGSPRSRPQSSFSKDTREFISASTRVPQSVDASVGTARSEGACRTKDAAGREAAYTSNIALITGLVNDDLQPFKTPTDNELSSNVPEEEATRVEAAPTLDPWRIVAQKHEETPAMWYKTSITITSDLRQDMNMIMLLPHPTPAVPTFQLYLDEWVPYEVRSEVLEPVTLSPEEVKALQKIMFIFLSSLYSVRTERATYDFLALFMPRKQTHDFDLEAWAKSAEGVRPASEFYPLTSNISLSELSLVQKHGNRFAFKRYSLDFSTSLKVSEPEAEQVAQLYVQATEFPRKADFFPPVLYADKDVNSRHTSEHMLRVEDCTIDNLPMSYAIFALFIPSILHRYKLYLLAEDLRSTVLAPPKISNIDAVLRAISASSTRGVDYQRLEYLGNSVFETLYYSTAHGWPPSMDGEKPKYG